MQNRRLRLFGEVSRYAVVGMGNVAIDVGILTALIHITRITAGPWFVVFATLGFVCAVANGYYWNGRWTFKVSLDPKRQFLPFVAVQLVGVALNDLIMVSAMHALVFQPVHPFVRVYEAKAAAIVIVAVWNFAASRSLVFRVPPVTTSERFNADAQGVL